MVCTSSAWNRPAREELGSRDASSNSIPGRCRGRTRRPRSPSCFRGYFHLAAAALALHLVALIPSVARAGTNEWTQTAPLVGGTGSWGPHTVHAVPTNPTTLFALFFNGLPTNVLYRSTDAGATWHVSELPSEGGVTVVVNAIAHDPANPTTLYLAGFPNTHLPIAPRIWRTTDLGVTWTDVSGGLPPSTASKRGVHGIGVSPTQPTSTVIALIEGQGACRSTNQGAAWTCSSGPQPATVGDGSVAPSPLDPNRIYAGTSGIPGSGIAAWVSNDAGATWSPSPGGSGKIVADPFDVDTAYSARRNLGLWRTSNAGERYLPLEGFTASFSIAAAPSNPVRVYATGQNSRIIQRSFDGGATVLPLPPAPDAFCSGDHALAIDPNNPRRLLVAACAGAGSGIWEYEDSCNDGTITPPETCEDDNFIDGDGCDSNCTTTGCGNGIRTAGEACDGEPWCNADCSVVMPDGPPGTGGGWQFRDVVVLPGRSGGTRSRYIDPPYAIGYDYAVIPGTGTPNFDFVRLFEAGDDLFDLYLYDDASGTWVFDQVLTATILHTFPPGGVDRFRILGIEASAAIDPSDPTGFVTEVGFVEAPGDAPEFRVSLTMRPIVGCATDVDCPACQACEPGTGCVVRARSGCRTPAAPGKGVLSVVDGDPSTGPGPRDGFVWRWMKGAATTANEFADPLVDRDYAVCVFDESEATPRLVVSARGEAGGTCGTKPCWKGLGKPAGTRGFKLDDKELTPDGLKTLLLKPGDDGKSQIVAVGKGENLQLPPLQLGVPVRVQLQGSDGSCWEATYSTPKKNDAKRFRAVAD